jgi:hypothetical protein
MALQDIIGVQSRPWERHMSKRSLNEELNWIWKDASLHELMDRYPQCWEATGPELVKALEDNRAQTLKSFSEKAKQLEAAWSLRIRRSCNNSKVMESALPHLIRSRMALLALNKCYQAAALGKASGKIRFSRINGYIIQNLLFSDRLTRKPASLKWFRFWWPFITQKRLLIPLVQPKGIYCFYSKELINELCVLVGDRKSLELGAGDGTLTRFLADKGIRINATDDYSWKHVIEYPDAVENLNARQALTKYLPQAVICSWPPPGNTFEQKIFSTGSVEIYIMIGSRYQFAAGNWESYKTQRGFEWFVDARLSSMVIPPELESAVLVFRRKI